MTKKPAMSSLLTKVTELIDTKYAEWDRLYRRAVQVYADIMGQQPQRLFYNDMLLGIAVHACSLHALRASIQAYRHYQQAEIVHAFLGADEAVRANDEIIRLRTNIRKASEAKVANGTMTVTDMLRDMTSENLARQTKALHEVQLLMNIYQLKYTTNN